MISLSFLVFLSVSETGFLFVCLKEKSRLASYFSLFYDVKVGDNISAVENLSAMV